MGNSTQINLHMMSPTGCSLAKTFARWMMVFGFALSCICPAIPSIAQQQPVAVIFDTDMGPDYDDVGALALLHAFADMGEAHILATVACTRYEGVASVIQLINTYFGRPDLPVGVPKDYGLMLRDWQHWTDTLRQQYPHTLRENAAASSAMEVYRKVLADQPDQSVTLITVGFMSNIAALLQSAPDHFSDLDGKTLVAKKVKEMVSMAGRFPKGREFNVQEDVTSALLVLRDFPRPVTFSGYEIGEKVLTGLSLIRKPQPSPVHKAYSIAIPMSEEDRNGRMSWDQTAVWVAVRGTGHYFKKVKGMMEVLEDGSNLWHMNPTLSPHAYLIWNSDPQEITAHIETLMMHQPTKNNHDK